MLTLSLLRHAKSSWKNPSLDDKDRALSARGREAAPVMGHAIAERGLVPELVLCSSSRRTRETLELALPAFEPAPKIEYLDALYHADPAGIMDAVEEHAGHASDVMVVGHNPGFHHLAHELIGSGPRHARDRLSSKLPTCGLVVVRFAVGSWSDVRFGQGELALFLVPSDLGLTPSPIDP